MRRKILVLKPVYRYLSRNQSYRPPYLFWQNCSHIHSSWDKSRLRHRVVVPAHQPFWPDGSVRQPYAIVNFILPVRACEFCLWFLLFKLEISSFWIWTLFRVGGQGRTEKREGIRERVQGIDLKRCRNICWHSWKNLWYVFSGSWVECQHLRAVVMISLSQMVGGLNLLLPEEIRYEPDKDWYPRNPDKLVFKPFTVCPTVRKFRMELFKVIDDKQPRHIWGIICAFPHILGSPSSHMTLRLLHSEFPYLWGKFDFLFYQCWMLSRTPMVNRIPFRIPVRVSKIYFGLDE